MGYRVAIRIIFSYRGVQCRETLKLEPTKANLKYAERLRGEIINSIALGTFNYADYFPNSKRARLFGHVIIRATTGELLKDYMAIAEKTLEPSTYNGYRKVCEGHLYPVFGKIPIRELSSIIIRNWITGLNLTVKTVRNIITPLCNMLDQALNDGVIFNQGYAVCFENLVEFVHSAAPRNHFVEEVFRDEVKMFPKQALRELIANALVHQDFQVTGTSVMLEMYLDRMEISNPGIPTITVERFIDEYRSRNEILADLMRRFGICEEKGSGIDKVVYAAEIYQLPAPDFRVGEARTTAVLFAHQDFSKMSKSDRVRACYQHACLHYLSNKLMSNQTLRERFKLPESKAATVSLVISAAKDEGFIKADDSETSSTRYARYLPFWA